MPEPPAAAPAPASQPVSAPTVPPEFVIKREGRDHILYRGLLALAHQQGLESIVVEVLQYPSAENNQTTVCRATVVTERGTFTEIGDANAQNTGRLIAQHAMRMAATRSKARALRDAVNVGLVAIEELGGEDVHSDGAPTHEEGRSARGASGAAPRPSSPAAPAPAPGSGQAAADVRIVVGGKSFTREQVWTGYQRRVAQARAAGGAQAVPGELLTLPTEAPLRDLVAASQALRRHLEPPAEPAPMSAAAIANGRASEASEEAPAEEPPAP